MGQNSTKMSILGTNDMKIATIETKEVTEKMLSQKEKGPIFLDIREKEEFEISHLRGAYHLSPAASLREIEGWGSKYDIYILYCSVGKRASQMANRMIQAGYLQVACIQGSIFAWANQGRPLYRGESQVYEVHPFNQKWGKYLDKEYHSQGV